MRRFVPAALALAIVVIGCQDATAPLPIRMGTRFLLIAVGGQALPANLTTGSGGSTAIADTLVFLTGGQKGWSDHHETRQATVQGALQTFHSVYLQLYKWRASVLNFYYPCPRDAVCAPAILETGRLAGDTLTITYGSDFLRERTYLRLR